MPRRSVLAALAYGLALVLAVAFLSGPDPGPPTVRSGEGAEAHEERGGAEELQEQRETVEQREEALAEALAAGIAGKTGPIRHRAAPGWVGEQLFDPNGDDWEPAIAADPNAPFVYIITTRYGAPKPCPGNCPIPHIALEVSADGGRTWSAGRPLCACKGSGQFDPIIEVVPDTGHVYAVYMNGFNVVFVRSTDHGASWSAPVPTYGNVSWNDKPVLATSDDGRDVYVSWNGPTGGDPWVAQSHDFGATWTQTKLVSSARYYFAFDADVAPDGTVYFSQSSLTYTGQGGAAEGVVQHHVLVSRDGGTTWEDRLVDTVELGEPCVAEGCSSDFYLGHPVLAVDELGAVVLLYDGATTPGGKQLIFARRSVDGGRTWSARAAISTSGEHATSPAVESTGNGDVRAWYMQTNGGSHDTWNVWYRSSSDGGATWSQPVRISDAISGAAYKSAAGFLEIYGDYGEVAITSSGKTIAVWGEGFSWTGPGGSWFNRQS